MVKTDDFEQIQWHDNAIHGIRIVEGDDECLGDLVLDVDFIVEWLPPVNGMFSFRIAPADLTFHKVSDLIISVDYASATAVVQPMVIHEIHREAISTPMDILNIPGELRLIGQPIALLHLRPAVLLEQPRMEPITSGAQYLSPQERKV